MDVTSLEVASLYWWDIEVLRAFNRLGTKRFFSLDIWREVDWEELRQLACAQNIDGISDTPIVAPGRFRRAFHALTVEGLDISNLARLARRRLAARVLP